MKIRLHIEDLRIEGVGPVTNRELAALITAELERLVAVHGLPPALERDGGLRLDARTIRISPGASREQMGVEIARRLLGEWGVPPRGWEAAPPRPVPVAGTETVEGGEREGPGGVPAADSRGSSGPSGSGGPNEPGGVRWSTERRQIRRDDR